MRIAFCGPSGSGKSTLTLELGDIINHSNKILPEHEIIAFSRPTYAARLMGYASANEVPIDDETQLKFQTQCLIQQIESEKVAGIHYVIDRTTIDNLAYLEFKLSHLKHTSFHKLYETMAIGLCNHDFLFYVPNFSDVIEDNGLRFIAGQKEVEAKFLDIFNRCNIIPHVVESKSLSDRLDEICEVIKLK